MRDKEKVLLECLNKIQETHDPSIEHFLFFKAQINNDKIQVDQEKFSNEHADFLNSRIKNNLNLIENADLLKEDDGKTNLTQKYQEIDNKINKFLDKQFQDDDDNFDKEIAEYDDHKFEILQQNK